MKYISDDEILLSEWDYDKNSALGIDPSQISIKSKKKVFWKCTYGHSWDAEPYRRSKGSRCRFCSGQAFREERSLSNRFPEIAKEWDYSRNGIITPDTITYGCKKKVFWICPKCNESYESTVTNRTGKNKRGCPYCCHNPKANPKNNLLLLHPELVKEWDYEKNKTSPDQVTPNSNKKYYWICESNHSFISTVNNRKSGTGCPYCSGHKVCSDNSLSVLNPVLAKEWHPLKNEFTPEQVSPGSNSFAWWICEKGHEWKAKINNRSYLKRGCPHCSKGFHTSVPEQIIYYFVSEIYPDAINAFKIDNMEIDIYIPSFRTGIEYDGENFHKSEFRYKKDLKKNKILDDNGIKLIRIREQNCHEMDDTDCVIIKCNYTSDYVYLNDVIHILLNKLSVISGIKSDYVVDVDEVKDKISSELNVVDFEKSFAFKHIELVSEWDYTKNAPLTPEMFLPMSDKYVSWICSKCGYKWDAPIKSRSRGYGCARCARRHQYSTDEWVLKASEIHKHKYNYSDVEYISSKTKVRIICSKHGVFTQKPSDHLKGKGCPFCSNKKSHLLNRLSAMHPDLAEQWDYDRNELKPSEVGTYHKLKFWWRCNKGENHSYLALIQQRIKGSGCAVCHGKQVLYETSLAYLYPQITKQWIHEKNYGLSPEKISPGSDKKVWWRCGNGHEWQTQVYNRTKGVGCKKCYLDKKNK